MFRDHLDRLYALPGDGPLEMGTTFLNGVILPQLTQDAKALLEAPINREEIQEAIKQLKTSKTPGSDGIPADFYQKYVAIPAEKLLAVYREASARGRLSDSMREAWVAFIPKPDRDPRDPAAYRLLSLMNVNFKILSSILTAHLLLHLASFIHEDQCGFISHRSTMFNIRSLTHIHHTYSQWHEPVAFALLDVVSLYIDDVLAYVQHPESLISVLLKALGEFGECSGLRVSFRKSYLFPMGALVGDLTDALPMVGLQWGAGGLRYLVIRLAHTADECYDLKYGRVLEGLRTLGCTHVGYAGFCGSRSRHLYEAMEEQGM
ncbi:hypothetical protein NDU88_006711 [Pleurodeles waltl]|uniref:Reverse transcriptase domain-containing protein n=1 Tax=Pleurodeles waltl TaxID=8319 RepID=A0AAV7ULT0_PLEWA|nr:hypothetical protein NDU88_006711 [Pleurodeles waltl]